jgi:pyridoxamine 5'-phosphate oxidase
MPAHLSIAHLRKEYTRGGLTETDASPDPILQFLKWLDEAIAARTPEPNAMTLATVDEAGRPAARLVLLKAVEPRGFSFFTSYSSRKGRELAANPHAALAFFWPELERQVRVEGRVSRLPRQESEAYFHSRPRGSQIAAWASSQSTIVSSRKPLEERLHRLQEKYAGGDIPIPPYWGGYLVVPTEIEFWQGRPSRLHDRLRYQVQPDKSWKIERLSP